jgi:carbon-monoxide dehydrogenase medium subunit
MPDIDLHECATLEEASTLMRRYAPRSRFLAGGTDLLVDLKTGRIATTHLVSLNRIDSLRGITVTDNGLRLGALTSITELNRSLLVRQSFAPLLDASRRMAAPPIRNVATVGGNIMSAVPCADLPPILMAMRAEVEVWSSEGVRRIALDAFFVGPRRTLLQDGEILIAVIVPKLPNDFGAAYERFGLREGNAIAVASVAASLQLDGGGTITEARLILGAVAPIPKLVADAGRILLGRPADENTFGEAARIAREAAQPISDVRGTAQFRRDLIEVLTRRALLKARERAGGARA